LQQAADPRGVGGAGEDRVDPDAIVDMVGGHRNGEREHGTLAGGVERAIWHADDRDDRRGAHHCRVPGLSQIREGGSRDPCDSHHVDVEDAVPLVVVVGSDVSLGAYPGVVDDHIEAPELAGDVSDRGRHARGVRDVARDRERGEGRITRFPVEDGYPRSARGQELNDSCTDAARAACDEGDEAVVIAHVLLLGSLAGVDVDFRRRPGSREQRPGECGADVCETDGGRDQLPRVDSAVGVVLDRLGQAG
jgi:hypothetical protein